jgi:hypothetical protein
MKIFSGFKSKSIFWFRIFGYGLCFKNTRIYPLLFSERNGYVKVLKIGKWNVRFLNRDNVYRDLK